MSDMNWSPYQEAIFDFVSDPTRGSAIINAVAGSGKTTTIVEAANRIPAGKKAIFLAFNKAIADELGKKLPRTVIARTTNSLGFKAYMDGSGLNFHNIKTEKGLKCLSRHCDDLRITSCVTQVCELAKLAKGEALIPIVEGIRKPYRFDIATDDRLGALATRHAVFPDDENISMATIYENVRVLLTRVIEAAEQGYIDFDDQIYLPLVRGWNFTWYDLIFVDESQDLNRLQHALLAAVLRKGGRVIAVGDRSQAIYGFRGSDTSSMDRLQEQYGAVELPLTVSWRCPKAVIAEAQKYVSHIEAAPDAKDGYVVEAPNWDHEYFQIGDMIVCRLNAPLIEVAYKLILSGVGCRIEGRDIGVGLQNIIRKQKAITINDLVNNLSGWSNRQVQRFQAKDDDDGVQRILDQYESIMAIISAEEHDSPDSVIGAIDRMFPRKKRGEDPKPTIVLSSIHKAKGLEAERVFILNRHLMPLKWAVRDWEKEQENNLIYVAITRAQDTLCYIDLEGYGAGDAQQ